MKLNGRMTKIKIQMPARGAQAGSRICLVEDPARLHVLSGTLATFSIQTS